MICWCFFLQIYITIVNVYVSTKLFGNNYILSTFLNIINILPDEMSRHVIHLHNSHTYYNNICISWWSYFVPWYQEYITLRSFSFIEKHPSKHQSYWHNPTFRRTPHTISSVVGANDIFVNVYRRFGGILYITSEGTEHAACGVWIRK